MSGAPMRRRAGALLLAAAGITVSSGTGAQLPGPIAPVCQEGCPNPVTDPAGAAACLARQQACTTKVGLYESYMAQLGLMTTQFRLPQLYVDLLQPFYRGTDLRAWRFAFGDRQPENNATTDCGVTYFNHQGMVNDLRNARLDEPREFGWLLHELRHFAQCAQLGGRDAYAKMWFGHLELAFLRTNSSDMRTLHDAMPMENDAARVAAANLGKIEPMRDRTGRLVRPLTVSLVAEGASPGPSLTGVTGTAVRFTARVAGGSTPLDFTWTYRRPGETTFRPATGLLRAADVLELLPDRAGTYEVRVTVGQTGAPLAPATHGVVLRISNPPTIARTASPLPAPTAVRTAGSSALPQPLGTLTVQVYQRSARSRRATAAAGASVTVGTDARPKQYGAATTDAAGGAVFRGLPLSASERLTISARTDRCGPSSVHHTLTASTGTARIELVC